MQTNKFRLIIAVSLLLYIPCLQAQEAIPASGGSVSGSTGSFSYSIGQVVYTTVTGINGIVPLGVQQPYTFPIVPGADNLKAPPLLCSVYPNPVTNILTLRIENIVDFSPASLSFQLYDIEGRLIEKNKITSYETNISMMNLAKTVYRLVVIYNNQIKAFNIIKN